MNAGTSRLHLTFRVNLDYTPRTMLFHLGVAAYSLLLPQTMIHASTLADRCRTHDGSP